MFLSYIAYVVDQIAEGRTITARRSQPSPINAVVGLFVWGIPSFLFALRGFRLKESPPLLLFATSNPHKIEEVAAILAPLGVTVLGLDAFENAPEEPEEYGDTFQANARIKAIYYAKKLGQLCLADDSGLEVDALNGLPGVHSARFADDEINHCAQLPRHERDQANNRKLLRLLENIPPEKRTARFVCAMCVADPDGNILAESRGAFEGVITDQPRGDNGFGYDPLLYLPDVGKTSAELTPEQKNARSHRGAAARAIAESLASIG